MFNYSYFTTTEGQDAAYWKCHKYWNSKYRKHSKLVIKLIFKQFDDEKKFANELAEHFYNNICKKEADMRLAYLANEFYYTNSVRDIFMKNIFPENPIWTGCAYAWIHKNYPVFETLYPMIERSAGRDYAQKSLQELIFIIICREYGMEELKRCMLECNIPLNTIKNSVLIETRKRKKEEIVIFLEQYIKLLT